MSKDFYPSLQRQPPGAVPNLPAVIEETLVCSTVVSGLAIATFPGGANCQEQELNHSLVSSDQAMGSDVVHSGGCHCRRVRWQVEARPSVVAWICNCSDCSMRGNTHFVVPAAKFRLDPGAEEFISTYTFGTHTAKHTFCKVCGITSFYTPRSNPDGVAVTVACVDPGTMEHVEYRRADGRNWEAWFARSDIAGFSAE